jgi:hypothetical protein
MVSIESSKRYHIDSIPEQSKRGRYTLNTEPSSVINFVSPFFSDNLARLKTLFPFKSSEELARVLEDSSNCFELALLNFQSIEKQRFQDEILTRQAQDVVKDLAQVKSMDEAVVIVKKVIQCHPKSENKSEKEEHIKVLQDHLKNVTNENQILKKAIVKLNDSHRENNEKEKEIQRLEKELEVERCRSYSLSIQLSQAMRTNEFTPIKNIF